jgi:hypothetical protein
VTKASFVTPRVTKDAFVTSPTLVVV